MFFSCQGNLSRYLSGGRVYYAEAIMAGSGVNEVDGALQGFTLCPQEDD